MFWMDGRAGGAVREWSGVECEDWIRLVGFIYAAVARWLDSIDGPMV